MIFSTPECIFKFDLSLSIIHTFYETPEGSRRAIVELVTVTLTLPVPTTLASFTQVDWTLTGIIVLVQSSWYTTSREQLTWKNEIMFL